MVLMRVKLGMAELGNVCSCGGRIRSDGKKEDEWTLHLMG